MNTRLCIRLTLAAGVTAAVIGAGVVPAVAGAASASTCGITWGSRAKAAPQMTSATVTGVRTARHDCFDRLVIDIAGRPAAGYDVRYIEPPYRAEGSGTPVRLAGGAVLQIVVRAPAYDANGRATFRPQRFDSSGFRTFKDLAWGGSFEGQSSFGVGVRARLPFRVLQLDGPGNGTRLVVDVAHRW